MKETINQYKWVVLAGMVVAVLIAVITANLHVLQFMQYKLQNDSKGVVSVLEAQVHKESRQDDWFFSQGMKYLMNQEDYSQDITSFFEEEYGEFIPEWKKEIVKAYSKKGLTLPMNKDVMETLINNIDDEGVKKYVTQLGMTQFEQGLALVYGSNPSIDSSLVDGLYKLLNIYPGQLSFEKFEFNLYELLNYTGEQAEEKIKFIISRVDSKKAKESIFKQLRNQKITEEQLGKWADFFNTTGLISPTEYATYKNVYGNICLIRSQYSALDAKEVELQNKKEAVDAQIGESNKVLESKKSEEAPLKSEISNLESSIEELTNYYYMALYIEKPAGTGGNEYIASVPRNGLFGMKPGSLKYIVKLETTDFVKEGIYNLNLYYKGTKAGSKGEECGYYVEVSDSDTSKIENMKNKRTNKIVELEKVQEEVRQLESQINAIKTENNYDETVAALKNIVLQRQEYSQKVKEEVIKLRQLFGLSNIEINMNKEK